MLTRTCNVLLLVLDQFKQVHNFVTTQAYLQNIAYPTSSHACQYIYDYVYVMLKSWY